MMSDDGDDGSRVDDGRVHDGGRVDHGTMRHRVDRGHDVVGHYRRDDASISDRDQGEQDGLKWENSG